MPDPVDNSYWRSLTYFHIYRVVVALVLLGAGLTLPAGYPLLASSVFFGISKVYVALAVGLAVLAISRRLPFHWVLSLGVLTDIAVMTFFMYVFGIDRSGFGYLMLVTLAGAGLVGQGRLSLFFAAMASVAVLLEQFSRWIQGYADLAEFPYVGLLCIGFFCSAGTAHLLSRRVLASETLARKKGAELEAQMRINERVIADMQDGVLVVDGAGRVRQSNPQAEALCGVPIGQGLLLEQFCPELAWRFPDWQMGAGEVRELIHFPRRSTPLQVRYLPGQQGSQAVLYLEDADRAQEQARQIKLAALGRLTANMAHEIRNPLAAISHAAELLGEDATDPVNKRLSNIVMDNTRRLNRLVEDVLSIGQRDKAQGSTIALKPFLATFLHEMVEAKQSEYESAIVDCADEVMLSFDRDHLRRILMNIVGNAFKFCTGKKGSVVIRVVVIGGLGRVDIDVFDDGPGIAAAMKNRIFEPFFTTRSDGTGLGLYIARELCEANHAALELLESGAGAHFRISGKVPT